MRPPPIVMVSDVTDPRLITTALDQGADDYITKPFGSAELVVRVRAAIRRAARAQPLQMSLVVRTGELVFDREARIFAKAGKLIQLTLIEFRLLEALAVHVGKVVPHRYLMSSVWGDAFVDDTHYLRIYIGYLRQKIENDPSNPQYILNEWGTGYRLSSLPSVETREPRGTLTSARAFRAAAHDEPSAPPLGDREFAYERQAPSA